MFKIILLIAILSEFMLPSFSQAQACNEHIISTTPTVQFSDNNDGTVADNKTGLIWKVCSEGQMWESGSCNGTAAEYSWQQALDHAQLVSNNGYASYYDWRLPNIKELSSIVEVSCSDPAINLAVFSLTPSSFFWSASPCAANSSSVCAIDFYGGDDDANNKSSLGYVRLVRGGL